MSLRRWLLSRRLREVGGAVAAVAIVLALAGCSTMQVKTDADPGADFSNYKTYAWVEKELSPELTTLTHRRIVEAVDAELAKKGFVRTANGAVDMRVTYQVIATEQVDVKTRDYGYWRGYSSATTDVKQYTEGTLVVDVIDAGRKQAVWRGWASASIGTPEQNAKLIQEAVRKMFSKFPPG